MPPISDLTAIPGTEAPAIGAQLSLNPEFQPSTAKAGIRIDYQFPIKALTLALTDLRIILSAASSSWSAATTRGQGQRGSTSNSTGHAIDALVANKTVLMIADRLSTVVAADQILVLENDHITEGGWHKQLLDVRCQQWYARSRHTIADLHRISKPT